MHTFQYHEKMTLHLKKTIQNVDKFVVSDVCREIKLINLKCTWLCRIVIGI